MKKKWYDKIDEEEFVEKHLKVCSWNNKLGKPKSEIRKRNCGRDLYKLLKRHDLPFGLRWVDYWDYLENKYKTIPLDKIRYEERHKK